MDYPRDSNGLSRRFHTRAKAGQSRLSLMAGRVKGSRIIVVVAVLVICICAGLPILLWSGVIRKDGYSDRYATIGEYFNPMTLVNVHESNASYIRVAGKTYHYHRGEPPGYLILADPDWMIFETSRDPFDGGPRTVHVHDLSTGVVTDIDGRDQYSDVLRKASGGAAKDLEHWWVHERSVDRVTLGLYSKLTGDSLLEFTTIDLSVPGAPKLESRYYMYDAEGNLKSYDAPGTGHKNPGGQAIPPPPGLSAAELIGEHRADAGFPPKN